MENNEVVRRRGVEDFIVAAMDVFNECQTNDEHSKEKLEILRRAAYRIHRSLALSDTLWLSLQVLTIDDVEVMFPRLTFSSKQKSWMKKRGDIPSFKFYTLRAHPDGSGAVIKLHMDVLLDHVLSAIELPKDSYIRYEENIQCSLGPVKYKGDTYRLYGTAEYLLSYDKHDKAATNLVVITAEKLEFKCCAGNSRPCCCGMAQIIALMAMVHNHRRAHGAVDRTVYGITTDTIDFWFFQIDDRGEVSFILLTAITRPPFIDYGEITGLLAYIFSEAVVRSQRRIASNGSQSRDRPQLQDQSLSNGS